MVLETVLTGVPRLAGGVWRFCGRTPAQYVPLPIRRTIQAHEPEAGAVIGPVVSAQAIRRDDVHSAWARWACGMCAESVAYSAGPRRRRCEAMRLRQADEGQGLRRRRPSRLLHL
jgi:hypothetical protein